MRPPRDSYEDVGRALRSALERAAEAELPRAAHRTLEAVVALVASYSRLEDNVTVEKIAEVAQLHPKTVEAHLRQLRDLGIVVYAGGRGRGKSSRVGLPAAAEKGAPRDSLFTKNGVPASKKGSRWTPKRESLRLPTREDSREGSRRSDRQDSQESDDPTPLKVARNVLESRARGDRAFVDWLRRIGGVLAESERDFREELASTWSIYTPELVAIYRHVALTGDLDEYEAVAC